LYRVHGRPEKLACSKPAPGIYLELNRYIKKI
jgi:hypothetical protein